MRLLIVEDNVELSRLVAGGLAAAGYQSDIVGSAAEARELVFKVAEEKGEEALLAGRIKKAEEETMQLRSELTQTVNADRVLRAQLLARRRADDEQVDALEKELANLEDADSDEEIRNKLRGLGYIS